MIQKYVFMEPKFIKSIENYVEKNNKTLLKYVIQNKNKIPDIIKNGNRPIYRGMVFTIKEYDGFVVKGIKLSDYSSWSRDLNTAKRFYADKRFRITNKKGIGVLFKKTMKNKIIIDIQNWYYSLSNMGHLNELDPIVIDSIQKEAEVLCDKGITLTKKDIIDTMLIT